MRKEYWGKTSESGWHHLGHHCLDVAAVARVLLDANPVWRERIGTLSPVSYEQTEQLLVFLASCHDLGKFHPGFQRLVPLGVTLGHTEGHYVHHHTQLGMEFWRRLEPEALLNLPDKYDLAPLVNASMGHHGKPVQGDTVDPLVWQAVAEDVQAYVVETGALFLGEEYDDDELLFEPLSWLAAGLFILSDWIGSDEQWFAVDSQWNGAQSYWPLALERAERAVASLSMHQARVAPPKTFAELFHELAAFEPRPMQSVVDGLPEQVGPELLIIEDLTGGGKTEAALLAAHRAMCSGTASGVYMGLPTMATANAMYGRLAETYQTLFRDPETSLVLAHGSTFLNDVFKNSVRVDVDRDEQGVSALCSAWLADSRKKALLAPCGAGTIDQALLGVLGSRHQALRLLGLCRSLLVVDEVHAFDAYTGTLIGALLTFHAALGGSAVLLSATMPLALRRSLMKAWQEGREIAGLEGVDCDVSSEAFPLLTRFTDAGVEETEVGTDRGLGVAVRPVHEESEVYAVLAEVAASEGCGCWIRNTVDDVHEARRVLVEEMGVSPDVITVFHARFTGADRARIESDVVARFGKGSPAQGRSGRLVLGTQVLEQSLDVDFDMLVSDLAPMELMIQRAGRCQRHSRLRPDGFERAEMVVLMPEPLDDVIDDWYSGLFPIGQYVYPRPALLWRTARLLRDKGAIVLPVDARELIEEAYGRTLAAPDVLVAIENSAVGEDAADRAAAQYVQLDFEDGYGGDDGPWGEERKAPTRLGEPVHGVRLIKVEADGVCLWAGNRGDADMETCLRSEVRVALRKVAQSGIPVETVPGLQVLIDSMPDKGRWCLCLPIWEQSSGVWVGNALNEREEKVRITYTTEGGVMID